MAEKEVQDSRSCHSFVTAGALQQAGGAFWDGAPSHTRVRAPAAPAGRRVASI